MNFIKYSVNTNLPVPVNANLPANLVSKISTGNAANSSWLKNVFLPKIKEHKGLIGTTLGLGLAGGYGFSKLLEAFSGMSNRDLFVQSLPFAGVGSILGGLVGLWHSLDSVEDSKKHYTRNILLGLLTGATLSSGAYIGYEKLFR